MIILDGDLRKTCDTIIVGELSEVWRIYNYYYVREDNTIRLMYKLRPHILATYFRKPLPQDLVNRIIVVADDYIESLQMNKEN